MEWLKIVTSNELVRISTDEIVYILADGNYCDIMLANGSTHKITSSSFPTAASIG